MNVSIAPQKHQNENYNHLLQNHLNTILKENKETIIVDDFNINYNEPSDNVEFKTATNQNGFQRIIKKSTRITKTTSTLIDLIMTNKPSSISLADVVATSLSDHNMISCI